MKLYFNFIIFIFLFYCDSNQNKQDKWASNLSCYSFNICNDIRGTRFGILGDSWTDLALGQPIVRSLRVQLEEDYHFKFTGSTVAGNTIASVLASGSHYNIIEHAGPDLKYMLISLGGDDFLFMNNFKAFLPDTQSEINKRLNVIQNRIIDMIHSGNVYKTNRWGGQPLIWIFHGYDYVNPDTPNLPNTLLCRQHLKEAGFTENQINEFIPLFINNYNSMLLNTATIEPQFRYIDLRGALGGPPFGNTDLMTDCIHPNTPGFKLITSKYITKLKVWSGDER